MVSNHRAILKVFAFKRIIIPVVIGLAVIGYMMVNDLSKGDLKSFHLSGNSIVYLVAAVLMIVVRDLSYMYRIRLMTNKQLSWRKAFQVIFIWEFSSCVTPSVVGGSAVAIFILTKEKIGTGRSTAIVMITAILDEFFYLILVPVTFLFAGISRLEVEDNIFRFLGMDFSTMNLFFVGYVIIIFITLALAYGAFINPTKLKSLLIRVTRVKFLKRFEQAAIHTGDQILETSDEFKNKSFKFWMRAFGVTALSWTARFMVVNFLIVGFTSPLPVIDHFLIMARQLMMWVIMLISPTPGGSGIAEFFFPIFLREFIAGPTRDLTVLVALSWRLITYYPYLIIGAMILPFWLKRVYLGRKLIKFKAIKRRNRA